MQILRTIATNASETIASQNNHAQNNAAAAAGTSGGTTTPPANSPDQLTNQSTFLQLLVSQIKNQNPLNPTDSVQFIGQLVQFSQLEQLLGINKGIQTLVGSGTAKTTPPAGTGK